MTDDATFTRQARLRLGFTLEQMGEALGYTGKHVRGQVHKIESGKRPLPRRMRLVIEALLKKRRV